MTSEAPRNSRISPAYKLSCQEKLARAVATTKGEMSVAALALKEFHRRRQAGEDVIVYPLRGKWIVATESEVKDQTLIASDKTRAVQQLARTGS